MADYYPLIARAVSGLENSTGEARRAMYERARSALIAQLRSVDPPLSESDITRERLALEEAVRKVEAEAAQRARAELPRLDAKVEKAELKFDAPKPEAPKSETKPERAEPAMARPGDALRGPLPPRPARSDAPLRSASPRPEAASPRPRPGMPASGRPRPAAPDQALRGLRDTVAEADTLGRAAAQASRSARRSFAAAGPAVRVEPQMESFDPEGTYYNESTGEAVRPSPPRPRGARPEAMAPRRPKRSGGIFKTIALVGLLLIIVGGLVWQGPRIMRMTQDLIAGPPPSSAPKGVAATTEQRPKIPDRVGQPSSSVAPVAQRVVLYDEDPSEPQGKQYTGTVVWRVDPVQGGANQPPDVAVRADVEIPDRKFKMSFSIRRNNDQTLPASHTAELTFTLPPDFDGGGITNVPGVLMKQNEQTRGTPLAGLAVKVTDGFFLVGLSNVETDRQRNVQLLKERPWIDIPMVYANQRRAILAVEKGSPGERAFMEAFAAWGQ